uniref:Proliferating cell nuclear antigen PCNA N-terminal domain-containing protein n=1 Tax=Paramoeba aestuarina TaxID=180227 RepID=A0A7S4PED9_9EUKA|mmetsp:Transcript_4830/g.7215  ORF Transcript_4830/g.7215 Transcript_4830/m.7215 type:complete len:317 (+) Transcript_4830:33-983(+)
MEFQLSNPVIFARCLRCLQELNDVAYLEISPNGLYFQVMDDSRISMATYELEAKKLPQFQFFLDENLSVNIPLKSLCSILFSMGSHDLLTARILPPYDEIHLRNDFDAVPHQTSSNVFGEGQMMHSALIVEPDGKAYGKWVLKLLESSKERTERRIYIPPVEYPVTALFPTDLLKDIIGTYEKSLTNSITFTVDYDTKSLEISPTEETENTAKETADIEDKETSDAYRGGVIRLNTRPDSPSAVVLKFLDKCPRDAYKLKCSLGLDLMRSLGKLKEIATKNWINLHQEKEIKIQCPVGDLGNLELYLAQVYNNATL